MEYLTNLDSPYHLVHVLLTESNPGGGWWFDNNAQNDEGDVLRALLKPYDTIAEKALSARLFPIACGLNLAGAGVIGRIREAFQELKWVSLVMPAAASLVVSEYACILPQLFTHIHYLGTPLSTALVRVWMASKMAAVHTDIVLFEKDGERCSVTKLAYGSASSRPWGLVLPHPGSLCVCARANAPVKWIRQGRSDKVSFNDSEGKRSLEEHWLRYRSSCNHVFLHVAICLAGTTATTGAGAQVIKQPFDDTVGRFPLDSRDWFRFKVYKVRNSEVRVRFEESAGPRTRRGQAIQAGQGSDK
ncbi:hypothetical protein FRC06_009564 [Ceratobasidium sp. 370]|nr:hypothetical protein FRC06_009564 [Ceratobasidium sp. 370]